MLVRPTLYLSIKPCLISVKEIRIRHYFYAFLLCSTPRFPLPTVIPKRSYVKYVIKRRVSRGYPPASPG